MASKSGKSSVNTFSGGMSLDIDKSLLKENQYRYAENVRTITNEGSTTGALTNIEGSLYMSGIQFATGETIVASHTVRDLGVLFTVLPSGLNKIYRLVFKQDNTLDFTSTIGPLYIGTKNVLATNGLELGLNPGDAISIVSRYEDDDNIKVYWADGKSFIRSINIAPSNDAENASVTLSSSFDIIPSADLKMPVIASIGSGRLNAGIIQYFYQLYGPSGTETMLSPGSAPVNLTASDIQDKSIKYFGTGLGETYGKPTGKSVKVGIEIPTGSIFNRLKLISVYYYDYSEVPVITIVKELDVASNLSGGFVYLEDGGTTAVGELTQAEFNLIGGNLFIPNYIESKDNILFAANVKEDTWDIEADIYDTRSYQFAIEDIVIDTFTKTVLSTPDQYSFTTSNYDNIILPGDRIQGTNDIILSVVGSTPALVTFNSEISVSENSEIIIERFTSEYATKLHKSNGESSSYLLSQLVAIQNSHDTIHDEIYKEERYADIKYRYNSDGKLGGSGLNVDYIFANTYFIESYSDFWGSEPGISIPATEANKYIDRRTARIGDIKRNISELSIRNSDGNYFNSSIDIIDYGIKEHEGPLNYANPYLANAFKSYQRDEIYRFAAVFYDNKGRKSPAHWIADIRFPAGYIKESGWDASIFEMPSETSNAGYANDLVLPNQELLVKPLGISFTFKNLNLLTGVTKIEIVRAKRDINNKTIYAQGVVQKTGTYRSEKLQKENLSLEAWDNGPVNTVRPHSIISMGDSYSIAPIVEHPVNSGDRELDVHYDDYDTNDYDYSDAVFKQPKYTTDSISPYFYNKNFILFINPETSYYGIDFSEQLIKATAGLDLDIVDIVSPMTTPALTGMTSTVSGSNYYGDADGHPKMQFRSVSQNKKYPIGMYAAADINKNGYTHDITLGSGNTFITGGFVGAYSNAISGFSTIKPERVNAINPNPNRFDIYIENAGTFNESTDRVYLTLGGVITGGTSAAIYNNGLAGINGLDADGAYDPAIVNYNANKSSRNALTFKFFNRFDKKLVGDDYGFNSVKLAAYDTNEYYSAQESILSKLDVYKALFPLCRKINALEYSGDIVPGVNSNELSIASTVSIGGEIYINWSTSLTEGDGVYETYHSNILNPNAQAKSRAVGIHGSGLILNLDNDNQLPVIRAIDSYRKPYYEGLYDGYKLVDDIILGGTSTFITNIKSMNAAIYGGSSSIDRQFTEYISTGSIIPVTSNIESKLVFGGDTFIGIFDYTSTYATDQDVDTTTFGTGIEKQSGSDKVKLNQMKMMGALIPLESSINTHIVNSKSFVASDYSIGLNKEPGVHSPGASGGSTWKYSQDMPQFDYNAAYSSEQTATGNTSKLLISESDNVFDCRVYSSESKTNDELYDKWATFKVANYIDVDTQFGEITGLKKFNDKLFFWQKNAFGVLSVNERSLIKDNNPSMLTLGTASGLTRFDYITTSNGFRKGMIGGITQSEGSLYWMDADNAELCVFSGSVTPLSKAKGIQTYLNQNKSNIQNHIPMIFDKKYNEIILTLNGLSGADSIV